MPAAKKPLFPRGIADQVADANAKQSYIISIAARLSISAERLSELADAVAKVNAAYARASDRENRSRLDTVSLQIALNECHEILRRIIDYSVKYNTSTDVLPKDFEALNIYRPGTKEPLPDPIYSPRLAGAISSDNVVTLSILNPLNRKRGKPDGCRSFDIVYRAGGERPQSIADLTERKNAGSTPVRIPFPFEMEDQPLYFAIRYIGTRGAFGPWTEIQKVMITR
jgi:hypothetical protein